jgi:hypothetical protein
VANEVVKVYMYGWNIGLDAYIIFRGKIENLETTLKDLKDTLNDIISYYIMEIKQLFAPGRTTKGKLK